jgi:predicted AAA+ superfamily ATPase
VSLLSYNIEVLGAQSVSRALAALEKRIAVHNQRVTHLTGTTARGSASPMASVARQQTMANAAARQLSRERAKDERERIASITRVNRVEMMLLKGIDRMRDTLMENTERFAKGLPANNALLWGARGMGKSSLVKAAQLRHRPPDS